MMQETTTRALLAFVLLSLAGCGYSSRGNEAIGQPKKISHDTPIFCSDYDSVDISLGVMRNGVGSMSTQDMWFAFAPHDDQKNEDTLLKAIKDGKLVKFTYDYRRLSICQEAPQVTSVEIVEDAPAAPAASGKPAP